MAHRSNHVQRAREVLVLLAMVLLACDSKAAGGTQDNTPSEGNKDQSRFLGDVGKEKHPEAKATNDALSVRFDFSGKKVYAFDYTQQAENVSTMGGMPKDAGPMKQKMDLKGLLVLKSKGDKTGTLVLKDLKMAVVMEMKKGEPPRSMEMQPPAMAVPDVREDGSMDGGAATAQPLLRLMFPMPPRSLKPGESADIPVSMPFNAMGSALMVKGTSKVTHGGYFDVGGKNCAKLEVEIDISKLDVPKEIEGKYACSARGKSVYYFDTDAQEFESGESAVLMKMVAEGKMPKLVTPQQDKPADLPKSIQMAMDVDTLMRIKRNPDAAKKEADGK